MVLAAQFNGSRVEKIFRFRGDDYLIDVEYHLENNTSATKQAAMYAQIKRDTREPLNEETMALGPQPYLGAAFTTPEDRYQKSILMILMMMGP